MPKSKLPQRSSLLDATGKYDAGGPYHYDRLAKALQRAQPRFSTHHRSALEILAVDPYNYTRSHHIKKLEGVRPGEGQYRLSLGRWRFRYDISGRDVVLQYCGLPREDTYH